MTVCWLTSSNPCCDRHGGGRAGWGETSKPVRSPLPSLVSAGNKVNSSAWAQRGKFHWHNVQNAILSQDLDPVLRRTNGRCIYIKHETPHSHVCEAQSFLPGFTRGLPSTISNYHTAILSLSPYKSPPLLLSARFAIICWLLLHPQKYRGPTKLFFSPSHHPHNKKWTRVFPKCVLLVENHLSDTTYITWCLSCGIIQSQAACLLEV